MSSSQLLSSCLAECNEAQCEAIRHVNGPLLVLAGPGSGKTRVITRRIGHLVGSGCRPDQILAITFTNKAAAEMRERVSALGGISGAWVFTFHAFCARVLRIYGNHVGLQPSFSIYDTTDSRAAVKRAMSQLEIDLALFKPPALAKKISTAKGKLWEPDDVAASDAYGASTIAKVYRKYNELLRTANAVDFDDLLMLVVKLLAEKSKASSALRRRFRYVLIDEYQDTNHAQYLIAKYLADDHGNLCATGDPDQSIYGWRGADIGNILQFEEDYPDARVVRLEQNYRSVKNVLAAADQLIAHNVARKKKSLWTLNPEGEKVRVVRCEDEHEEALEIAETISRWVKAKDMALRDVAVFYRINAQSRVLESALRSEAIPYSIVAGTEFYQRKEIKDLMAYLRLVVNPADDVSAERVANVPSRRLGTTSVNRLKAWASKNGLTVTEAMARPQEAGVRGAAVQACKQFLNVLAAVRSMPASPVAPVIEKLIKLIAYEQHLRASTQEPEERIANVQELVSAATEFNESEPEGDLAGFLEQAALISDVDRWDKEQGSVTLMTLHAAKGLEFPGVFIVGLEDGLLPLARDEIVLDLEEERRLLFVGITRAKQRAVLTYAESRTRYGRHEYASPSRFLAELPDDIEEERRGDGFMMPARPNRGSFQGGFQFSKTATRSMRSGPPRKSPRRVKRSETEEIVYDGERPMDDDAAHPFAKGDAVNHPTYGRGVIVDMSGYGDTATSVVRFPTVGVKKLRLKYARLRLLDDDAP